MAELIFNVNHCAEYIEKKLNARPIAKERDTLLTVEDIVEILELETEYMIDHGYTE